MVDVWDNKNALIVSAVVILLFIIVIFVSLGNKSQSVVRIHSFYPVQERHHEPLSQFIDNLFFMTPLDVRWIDSGPFLDAEDRVLSYAHQFQNGNVRVDPSFEIAITPFSRSDVPELSLFTTIPFGWNEIMHVRWLMDAGGLKLLNDLLEPKGLFALPACFNLQSTNVELSYAVFPLIFWKSLDEAMQKDFILRFQSCVLDTLTFNIRGNLSQVFEKVNQEDYDNLVLHHHKQSQKLIHANHDYARVLFHITKAQSLLTAYDALKMHDTKQKVKEFLWPDSTSFCLTLYKITNEDLVKITDWLQQEVKRALKYPKASLIQGFFWVNDVLGLLSRRENIPCPDLLKTKDPIKILWGFSITFPHLSNCLRIFQNNLKEKDVRLFGHTQLFTGQTVLFTSDNDVSQKILPCLMSEPLLPPRRPLHFAFVSLSLFSPTSTTSFLNFLGSQEMDLDGSQNVLGETGLSNWLFQQGWQAFLKEKAFTNLGIHIDMDQWEIWSERAVEGKVGWTFLSWTERGELVAGTRNTFDDALDFLVKST